MSVDSVGGDNIHDLTHCLLRSSDLSPHSDRVCHFSPIALWSESLGKLYVLTFSMQEHTCIRCMSLFPDALSAGRSVRSSSSSASENAGKEEIYYGMFSQVVLFHS